LIKSTRSSAISEGLRDALSVEILSTAAKLYKKSHLKMIAMGELKVIEIAAIR